METPFRKTVDHPFSEHAVRFDSMTTTVEIVAGETKSLAQEGSDYLQKLVNKFNRFDPKSEWTHLHEEKETWVSVSPEVMELLVLSKRMESVSGGFFRLDFEGLSNSPNGHHGFELDERNQKVFLHRDTQLNAGGIGKGFIVDKVVQYLKEKGASNILVNAGGDCRVSGKYPWKIGLFNPLDETIAFGHIKVREGAVVTSGIYARKHKLDSGKMTSHFFNTREKSYMEAPPYASVTVVGYEASVSEVFAKLILMGEKVTLPKKHKAVGVTYPDYQVVQLS